MLAIVVATSTALLPSGPSSSHVTRPSLHLATSWRAATLRMGEGDAADTADDDFAWPQPAKSFAELQDEQAKAKDDSEAAALASPKPFKDEDGGFSAVAAATVLAFVAGGTLFFSGISGGGALKFAADDQLPTTSFGKNTERTEVQACIQRAQTRAEAGACLPPVPLT